MDAKYYLDAAYRLDTRINSKLEAISYLNDLATKCTTTYSDMPHSPNRGSSRMEETIVKIIDLENSINEDIDKLVELKRIIHKIIASVREPELATLLELRYLSFKSWEQIAVTMDYSIRYIHKLHARALESCVVPEKICENEKVDTKRH